MIRPYQAQCPACGAASARAKPHCPERRPDGARKCLWYVCACGTTWNIATGAHMAALSGAPPDEP